MARYTYQYDKQVEPVKLPGIIQRNVVKYNKNKTIHIYKYSNKTPEFTTQTSCDFAG